MSRTLRIALAQFDFPVGAVAANAARMAELLAHARDVLRADVVVFPELALCGCPPQDLLLRPAFLAECEQAIERLAQEVHGIVAIVGWPQVLGAQLYDSLSLLRDGRIQGSWHKRAQPSQGLLDARRYFAVAEGEGPLCFDLEGVRVGVCCLDDLDEQELAGAYAAAGAELLLLAEASAYVHGRMTRQAERLADCARRHGLALACVNLSGGQDELVFDGSSMLVDADGRSLAPARAFSEQCLLVEFDADVRRFEALHWQAETDAGWESLSWRALVRGIRDYLGKNGFERALLGLSGGVDSALVLALAVDALGADRVTAVRLPSRYTSDLSNDLATEQARALGVKLHTLPIEAPFSAFLQTLAPLFAGQAPDLSEENLQSRCRGALLMALSNKFGDLLLTTGNKSEYAVGYATIYGDMCGGYAPLKDLYKTEVFALCRWRNAQGDGERIPAAVIERPPSAELRENQTDQDSLPPYPLLDALLQGHIEGERSALELIAEGHDADTVHKVLRLVRISEWKRCQSAPGPCLSTHPFGRGRRYPITSGYGG